MSTDPVLVTEMVWWIRHALDAVLTVGSVYVGLLLGRYVVNWLFE